MNHLNRRSFIGTLAGLGAGALGIQAGAKESMGAIPQTIAQEDSLDQQIKHWQGVAIDTIAKTVSGCRPWSGRGDGPNLSGQTTFVSGQTFKWTPEATLKHDPDFQLERLLERPCLNFSFADLLQQTTKDILQTGDAYWWLFSDAIGKRPAEILPLASKTCWPRMGLNGICQVDVRQPDGSVVYVPWDQVAYFQMISPAYRNWEAIKFVCRRASRDRIREIVLGVYGVPLEIAGFTDAGKEIKMGEPIRRYMSDTIRPLIGYIADRMTTQIAHRFNPDLRVVFPRMNIGGE